MTHFALNPSLRKNGTSCGSQRQVCTMRLSCNRAGAAAVASSLAALLVSCTQLDTIELMQRRTLQRRRDAPELRSLCEVFDKREGLSDRKRDKTITRNRHSHDNLVARSSIEAARREV